MGSAVNQTLSERLMLHYRRLLVVVVHLSLWTLSLLGAFLLRFDFTVPPEFFPIGYAWWGVLVAIRGVSFASFGLFSGMWRYTGARDLVALVKAASLSTVIFGIYLWLGGYHSFPRSIVIIDWLVTMILVGGLRFGIRTLWQLARNVAREQVGKRKRLLIVGAGNAGEMPFCFIIDRI